MDKDNNAEDIAFLLEQLKDMQQEQNKEILKRLEKLEHQNTHEYRDINNKLSNYAQKIIEDSKGPLKPEELQKFLTDDAFNKHNRKILSIIRKYSNNIHGVKKQILWIYDNLETHMVHRKQQKELDDKLIKRIRKIDKSVEEENKNEKLPLLKQSTLDEYLSKKPDKQRMPVKQAEKSSRKRKSRINYESCSSQESEVTKISSRFSKRLKLNSPDYSAESSHSSDLMLVDERNSEHAESVSMESVQDSQSSAEPMSVESVQGSQSSAEPMLISNSEGSSSQSDETSVDDPKETVKKTKSTKKLRGKVSKQSESRIEDTLDHHRNEETVPERHFRLRSETNR